MSRAVDEDTKIVTLNVISLYTSTPDEAIYYFWLRIRRTNIQDLKKDFVLESPNFILKTNTFDYKFYLHITGTAMSTIFAHTYMNLIMRYHEIKICCSICHCHSLASKYFENSWFRFLDECQISLKVNLIKQDHLRSILKRFKQLKNHF